MATAGGRKVVVKRHVDRLLSKRVQRLVDPKKVRRRDLTGLGKTIIKEMRSNIAKGISPIRGQRRFPAYKNPKKYPGKKKPRRPVNLMLTGKFLKQLTYRTKTGSKPFVRIGFFKSYGKTLEKGHREGANTQPKRPIIPIDEKEEFTSRIILAGRRVLIKSMEQIIKRRR